MPYGSVNVDLMTTSDGVSSSGLYGFKNRIINGAMVIDQRNAGASVTPADQAYTLDRWVYIADQASKCTIEQTISGVSAPAGFSNYLGVTSTAATTITTSQVFGVVQRIEGYNMADFAWGTASAATVTLSFWVRSSLTGTFGGSLRNDDGNYNYPFSYTISSANTWEQKSVTITGATSGTWLTTNGRAMQVVFGLGAGATVSGTAGAWSTSNFWSATGATQVLATNGATFYVTGVQLEVGSTATSFDYRPYGTELQLCQRYYYRVKANSGGNGLFGVGWCRSTTEATVSIPYPTAMRTNPTALEQSGTAANYQLVFAASAAALSAVPVFGGETTTQGTRIDTTVASGLTAGHGVGLRAGSTSAYLAWSAEL
jgi:hypothetical protein